MNFIFSKKLDRVFIYVLVIIYVLYLGVIIEPDTSSYVHLSIISSSGYPVFLYGFKKIFEGYFYEIVLIVQLIVNIFSIYSFARFLQNRFVCNQYISLLFDVILLMPLCMPNLIVANKITSEALAYPLFLMIVLFLIKFFLDAHLRSFFYAMLLLFFAVLVRTQFFFIVPSIVLLLIYFLWKTKNKKKYGVLLLIVVLLPVIVSIVDRTFHYLVSDRFASTSNTGVQIASIPFFVSDKGDYVIFEDVKTQNYYKYIYEQADANKMLDDYYQAKYNDNVYHYFHDNYARLSYEILSVKGREYLQPSDPKSVNAIIENNKLLISMTIPLLIKNLDKCIDLFLKNVVHAFGGVYLLILYLLILVSSIVLWFKKNQEIYFVSLLFMLLTFSNVFLVCLVEHSIDRFMIYHQWFMPVLFVLLINEVAKNKKKHINEVIS